MPPVDPSAVQREVSEGEQSLGAPLTDSRSAAADGSMEDHDRLITGLKVTLKHNANGVY